MFRGLMLATAAMAALSIATAQAGVVGTKNSTAIDEMVDLSNQPANTTAGVNAFGPRKSGQRVVGTAEPSITAEPHAIQQDVLQRHLLSRLYAGTAAKTKGRRSLFVPNLGTGRLTPYGTFGLPGANHKDPGMALFDSWRRGSPVSNPVRSKIIYGGDDWSYSNRNRSRSVNVTNLGLGAKADSRPGRLSNKHRYSERNCLAPNPFLGETAAQAGDESRSRLITFIDGVISKIGSVFNCLL